MKSILSKLAIVTAMSAFCMTSFVGCEDEEYYDDEYGYEYDDEYSDYDENGDWEDYQEDGQNSSSAPIYNSDYGFGTLGSASELEGTTVVVSVFANDTKTSWDRQNDVNLMYNSLSYLGMACEWISDNVKEYGCNANFIYDWSKNEDLYFETSINTDLTADDMDMPTWEYIYTNIDSSAILSKYSADNILYMVYVNTPDSNQTTSCTRNYYIGMEYPYEICYMYMACDGYEENPAAFAHEMLHAFGAPDLYRVDDDGENYGVTQEMVSYYESTKSNDIMFTTYDAKTGESYLDRITNDFTELDAYYVGLTSSSETASEWGLQRSQHNK